MTKSELVQKIEEKFSYVSEPKLQRSDETGAWYIVSVLDVQGDNASHQTIAFYVVGEGTVEEKAYWSISEPKPAITIVETLAEKVKKYLADKTLFCNVVVEQLDAVIVDAVSLEGKQTRILVRKKADGTLEHFIVA